MRNLCLYPEYIEPLLKEIREFTEKEFDNRNQEMPYLDSFLKETARLNLVTTSEIMPSRYNSVAPLISKKFIIVGIPRKVMSPFTFSDGTYVPADNWICVPQQAPMTDPTIYPKPNTFDGFRFVVDETARSESRLTHSSWAFLFWGSVRQSWSVVFSIRTDRY